MLYTEESHILKFSSSFIVNTHRDRFEQILTNYRIRRKLLQSLGHFRYFIDSTMKKIVDSDQNVDGICNTLSIIKSLPNEVYIISESKKFDAKFLTLDEGLSEIVGAGYSSIVSIVPGELAYYEGEGLGERYLLSKNY